VFGYITPPFYKNFTYSYNFEIKYNAHKNSFKICKRLNKEIQMDIYKKKLYILYNKKTNIFKSILVRRQPLGEREMLGEQ